MTLQTESLNLQTIWYHDIIYGLYCRGSRKSWCTIHPKKLTSQRKTNHLKMHFLVKLGICHWYVSLPNSTVSRKATQSSNSAQKSTRNPLLPSKHLLFLLHSQATSAAKYHIGLKPSSSSVDPKLIVPSFHGLSWSKPLGPKRFNITHHHWRKAKTKHCMGKHATIELQDPQGVNMMRTQKDHPENNPNILSIATELRRCYWKSHPAFQSAVRLIETSWKITNCLKSQRSSRTTLPPIPSWFTWTNNFNLQSFP